MGRKVGITWDWAEAGRGALCALPAAVIMLAVDLTLGMAFAIVTLPVAMLGVPPHRRQRLRLGLVGLGFAVSYALGSVLGSSREPIHLAQETKCVSNAWYGSYKHRLGWIYLLASQECLSISILLG